MKTAYLDLGIFGIDEDYSLLPKRYGGGRCIGAEMKEFSNFHIFARKRCFENIDEEENRKNCHVITEEQKQRVLNDENVFDVIPGLKDFDILFHCHTAHHFNTGQSNIKQVVWTVGLYEVVHEKNVHLLSYNDYQFPQIKNPETKIYKFTLGKRIPYFFQRREKSDMIFQCTRHVPEFSSIEIASFCLKNGIKGVFAGPIAQNYRLMDYIDNKTTYYLGEISEEEKINLTKQAKIYALIHNWPTPFNLSAIEALGYGTPVACTTLGFWPSLIKHKENGWHCYNDDNLLEFWENRDKFDQSACYLSACKHNHFALIETVNNCLDMIAKS